MRKGIKIIFHGVLKTDGHFDGCTDGFGSALIAWTIFRNEAEYIPVNYGKELDNIATKVSPGDKVYILDLNCTRAQLHSITQAAGKTGKVVFLDHHKDSVEQLARPSLIDLALNDRLVDSQRSGAMLTHDHFFPGDTPPALIEVLQRRDLWQDDSPEWNDNQIAFSGITSTERSFMMWEQLLLPMTFTELVDLGRPTYQKRQQTISGYVKGHILIDVLGEKVPATYSPSCWSEVCQELARTYSAPIGLAWRNDPNDSSIRRWDVRSLKGTHHSGNAHAFAQIMGGGGHPDAAGFQLPRSAPLSANCLHIKLSPKTEPAVIKMLREYSSLRPGNMALPPDDELFIDTQGYRQVCRNIQALPIEGLKVLRDYYHCSIQLTSSEG